MTGPSHLRRLPRRDERGFTLVELLVVMIVLGILAGIAVPLAIAQRRKAYEATTKSDVQAITKEVLALLVDGAGPFTVAGSAGTWTLSDGSGVVATGALSLHNEVSPASVVTSGGDFCVSVRNSKVDAQYWGADDGGLRRGDCSATP